MTLNLSPTVRTILVIVGTIVTALAAGDPFGLPAEAQAVIGALAFAFGALGLVPPQTGGTQRAIVNPV